MSGKVSVWSLGGSSEGEMFCRDTVSIWGAEDECVTVGLLLSGCRMAESVSVWSLCGSCTGEGLFFRGT